jgi:phosphate:Na+ symporter
MGELIEPMLARIPDLLTAQTPAPFEQVARAELSADRIFGEISSYLADIGSRNLGEDSVRAEIQLLHIVSELEHAGDAIFKISLLARKRFDESLTFSTGGVAEMIQLHDRVGQLFHESLEAFRLGAAGTEGYASTSGSDIVTMERQLRETHLGRLSSGLKESRSTSAIHLDILSGLQRISEHALRIRAIARELREMPRVRHDVGMLPGLPQG